jgi:hypothetical protein
MGSRHKRHLQVLKSLVKSGWKVEACYHRQIGFGGDIDARGQQVFWPLNGAGYMFIRSVYYAPPDLMGGGKATFILVRTVHAPYPVFMRINGWGDLSRFAVHERRAKEAKAKEVADLVDKREPAWIKESMEKL